MERCGPDRSERGARPLGGRSNAGLQLSCPPGGRSSCPGRMALEWNRTNLHSLGEADPVGLLDATLPAPTAPVQPHGLTTLDCYWMSQSVKADRI